MTNKKIKNGKKTKSSSGQDGIHLFVQVFQMGIVQIEKKFQLNRLFSKNVKLGCFKFCDLYIPFEKNIFDMNMFKIGKGNAEVFLDPRLEGYINTSHKFGDLREFTSPRDALGILTSVDDPLPVKLGFGARGRLRFNDFEVIFKVGYPEKEKVVTNIPQLSNNIFALPESDILSEKLVIPLSALVMIFIFASILNWLLNFPAKNLVGFLRIPSEVTAEFIAPQNMRLLPYVFGDNFIPDQTPKLALLWIKELQNRWESIEEGKEFSSSIPFLKEKRDFPVYEDKVALLKGQVAKNYAKVEQNREEWIPEERYYTYIKKSPYFASIVSGKDGQSNYFTIEKRLHQLSLSDKALIEYLKLEHIVLKEYYLKEHDAKKKGIVDVPQTGQVIGAQPDPIFKKELVNYQNAEVYAKIAIASSFRKNLNKNIKSQNIKDKLENDLRTQSVFITSQDFIYPYEFLEDKREINLEDDYETFLYNANFSDIFILPPLPKPKPTIDIKMVEFVVYNKKEEIRSCYNSSLRRNPNLTGQIFLKWFINENGKAENIQTDKSALYEKNLFHCVQSRIASWSFPRSKNGAFLVHFPFKFVKSESE